MTGMVLWLQGYGQVTLLNEDFGAEGTTASDVLIAPTSYDLDPTATYLASEAVAINYYGVDKTSEGKYDGASGGNFFLLGNNWNADGVTLTWANMDVANYSLLDDIVFGCAFAGNGNDAWTGNWLFNLQYSFDDVVADPEAATWQNFDLISNASGWPDPTVAGGDNWSMVTVNTDLNIVANDRLSIRIKSNGTFDYHFDDLKFVVKTPSSGMERVTIAKETFGASQFYKGPASDYENYSNGGVLTFIDYNVHYQNYGDDITTTYDGNSNDGNWWISNKDDAGVSRDTLVFSLDTREYADVQLQFGFTYWGGTPGNMIGLRYTADSVTWSPIVTVSSETPFPGTNTNSINDGYFHLIKYDDILPRAENLTIKIYQLGAGQFIMDDIQLTGVYSTLSDDATLASISFPDDPDLQLQPEFDAGTMEYDVLLPSGTVDAPVIEAVSSDPGATVVVEDALNVNSEDVADRQSYVLVEAADGETQQLYTITFSVDPTGKGGDIIESTAIYPNPATGQVRITSVNEVRECMLIDAAGKKVMTVEHSETGVLSMDVSALSRGIYVLVVLDDEGNRTSKKLVRK